MQSGKFGFKLAEGANAKAMRGLMIGLAALVVLAVSGYGTVIYIQLMGKVFPAGPLLLACYMGAAANLLLMLVLLVGKFVWFRPGAHEVASWIVTGVELLVAILNMMLAYEVASGQKLTDVMQGWYYLAPISPVFSMIGAIVLIMTSTELRKRHKQLAMQEEAEVAQHQFDLAMHKAHMEVKNQYLTFVKAKLGAELNAPERQVEISNHASLLVSDVLSGMSGLASVPRLNMPQGPGHTVDADRMAAPGLPPVISPPSMSEPAQEELDDQDGWLARVNGRIAQARDHLFRGDGTPKEEGEGQAPQRVEWLIRMAEANGLDLRRVEPLLGLPSDESRSYYERGRAVVEAATRLGYSLEDVEHMLGLYGGEGGDAAKKK